MDRFAEPSTWASVAAICSASIYAPDLPYSVRIIAFIATIACAVAGIVLREYENPKHGEFATFNPTQGVLPMPDSPSTLSQAAAASHAMAATGMFSALASIVMGLFHTHAAAQSDPAAAAAHMSTVQQVATAAETMATLAEALAASGVLGGAGVTVTAGASIVGDIAGAVGQSDANG